jgi:hypothetical protein
VILYMLLTGHRPFQGNSPLTISLKVVNHKPVPAAAFDLNLPAGVDYVLSRALAKDPAQRYQRGMEMSLDLQNLFAGNEPGSQAKHPTGPSASLDPLRHPRRGFGVEEGPRVYAATILLRKFGEACRSCISKMPKRWVSFASWAFALLVLAVGLFALEWRLFSAAFDQVPSQIAGPITRPVAASDAATHTDPEPSPIAPRDTKSATRNDSKAPSIAATARSSRVRPPSVSEAPGRTAIVSIQVESRFEQGTVTVWVDDQAVLHQELEPAEKKTLGLFRRVHTTASPRVQIVPGEHQMRVRIQASNPTYDQSHILRGTFAAGAERVLRVSFGRRDEMKASLK